MLNFSLKRKVPVILQHESAECGLACLAMIVNYYGNSISIITLRNKYKISLQGTSLNMLMIISDDLQLQTRPIKIDIENLENINLPCILHWEFNHFVILTKINHNNYIIHDPAIGVRKINSEDFSKSFTGIALEIWPKPNFNSQNNEYKIKKSNFNNFFNEIIGIKSVLVQIFFISLSLELVILLNPQLLQWIIDQIIPTQNESSLSILALSFVFILAFQVILDLARENLNIFMKFNISLKWQANIVSKILDLPVDFFEKRSIGDIASKFGSINTILNTITSSFMTAIFDGIMSILILSLLLFYSPLLTSIVFIFTILYLVIKIVFYYPQKYKNEERIIHTAKQNSHFLESIRGVKTIKTFNAQIERKSIWFSLLTNQINSEIQVEKINIMTKEFRIFLFGLENIVIIYLATLLVLKNELSVGSLVAFVVYKTLFTNRITALIDKLSEIGTIKLHHDRLRDISLTEPEIIYPQEFMEINSNKLSIKVKNISFSYSNYEKSILNNITFEIPYGQSVAITGASGSGKSTLLNILLGILAPTTGDVFYGEHKIKELGLYNIRSLVGTVLQEDVLFSGSIADNISFFDASSNLDWIQECAKMAAIHEEIINTSMGYNTLIGEMGTVLSGGQKQRILLARALYKRPKILFLDEATSNLDIYKEFEVNNLIKKLKITRFIIAHRQETINSADRVLIIEDGILRSDIMNS
ncbi:MULTISPECIES: peptidase domain-containing ABC transporter [Acinetobacter]|uniref:peptidase domain-containing ABC transporter n=1 Tax=Acinetobacter TaxID=469 RepID=UPI000F4DAEF9|nr:MULTISPECIES: peptidase domain-containing ABC transporter [Acinetobacter]AYX85868.1 peptidase domain-containing ABC transporter [Acinetobacter baumannii]MCR8953441.1 peptidase domain-containing ABC transporter [Acinetobacter baumannii]MDI9753827.1 peptidase domain-containing ABC transporter [Acinetobacter baumannii]MEB3795374.1 peptidase domain-containing ABC transporter [Acinetobacter sp. IK24]MEB3814498.1 peptidase domain-containing ABC transporter [Acinetobacter sp. IK22]